MRRENINYLVVGTFVLLMGAGLMVVLYQITGRTGPTDTYHVFYQNVSGIKYGTPVLYEGYQIGQVERIVPEHRNAKTVYRVDLSVQQGWRIPSDSIASVVASGLLSAVSIDIREGSSQSFLKPGAEIAGHENVSIFAALNDVAADFRDLSRNSIQPVLQNFNKRMTELSNQINDLTKSSIRPLVDSLRKRVDNPKLFNDLNQLTERLNESAGRLQQILDQRNRKHIAGFLTNADAMADNLNGLVVRMDSTRVEMEKLLGKLNTLVDTNKPALDESVEDLRKSMRVIAQHIDSVTYNLEGSSRNMYEFTRQIRENPGLLLRGSPQEDPGQNK